MSIGQFSTNIAPIPIGWYDSRDCRNYSRVRWQQQKIGTQNSTVYVGNVPTSLKYSIRIDRCEFIRNFVENIRFELIDVNLFEIP